MNKKILSLGALAAAFLCTESRGTDFTYGDFNCQRSGNAVSITGYHLLGENVTIPSSIYGLPVTSIGDYAFSWCSSLTNVVVPNSVTRIGEKAFYECSYLLNIVIPNSVTDIGYYAFIGCSSLHNVVIPNKITSISYGAFSGCSSLTNVVIPNSVTVIGDNAFSGCSSLTNVVIPNSVSRIGAGAFRGCSYLLNVVIPNKNTSFGIGAFRDCGWLTSIVIPNKVTFISPWTFSGCTSLLNVVIPNSVSRIGDSAFRGCSSLTNVVIPNSVSRIGDSAFRGCSSLTNVVIPNKVTSIENGAFSGCSFITNIVIPNSITNIGYNAFMDCGWLTSIVIPNTVTSIGSGAFSGCYSLTHFTVSDETWIWLLQNASDLGLDPTQMIRADNPSLKKQTITFSALKPISYTNAPFALAAKASSSLPVSFKSSDLRVATVSGGILTPVGVGTTTITAHQSGNSIYNPATPVTQTQVIAQARQEITFSPIPAHNYGEVPFALAAQSTSRLPITYTSAATNVATVLGNVVTIVGTGTAMITASQLGNALYSAAKPMVQNLTVAKANQTITLKPTTPIVYTNGGIINFNGTASSGFPLTYTSSKTNIISIVNGMAQGIMQGRGTTSITATQAGNSNFNKATVTSSITVQ